jgi:hypothetical protein
LPAPTGDRPIRLAASAFGSDALKTHQLATPNEGMRERQLVNSYFQPGGPQMIESQTIIQPKQGSLRWAKPLDTELSSVRSERSRSLSWRWPHAWPAAISAPS